MRAVVVLIVLSSLLPAQVVSGWKGQPRLNPSQQAPTRTSRPFRNLPNGPRRLLPLSWGNSTTEVIVVQPDTAPEKDSGKKAAYPADLVINPLWEKEKVNPKMIEIP